MSELMTAVGSSTAGRSGSQVRLTLAVVRGVRRLLAAGADDATPARLAARVAAEASVLLGDLSAAERTAVTALLARAAATGAECVRPPVLDRVPDARLSVDVAVALARLAAAWDLAAVDDLAAMVAGEASGDAGETALVCLWRAQVVIATAARRTAVQLRVA